MFKPKKSVKPLPTQEEEIEEEELEEEIEEEIEEEEPKKVTVKKVKKIVKKSPYNVGDIIPITQTVGYQVIKEISEDGEPLVTSTDKLSEAEILSFIYQQ